MSHYTSNIERETLKNNNFRKVLYTAKNSQLVVMSLLPKEEIGNEVHPDNDQFFRVESGTLKAIIDNKKTVVVKKDGVLIIPKGTYHNIINASSKDKLKLYTIYSPPHHKDGKIHKTKEIAEKDLDDEYEE
jgi:mannose-6-phosphate isomerase-like protein (cupin superfamily)